MSLLRLIACRAEATLFAPPAARVVWALLGAALGLWQGPVAMIAMTIALIALSELLGVIARRPAAPRLARPRAVAFSRPQRA